MPTLACSPSQVTSTQRSSLESLAELERLLEEQHRQLIAKGFIPPTQQWAV